MTSNLFKPIRFFLKSERLIPIIGRGANARFLSTALSESGVINLYFTAFISFTLVGRLACDARGVLTIVGGS